MVLSEIFLATEIDWSITLVKCFDGLKRNTNFS